MATLPAFSLHGSSFPITITTVRNYIPRQAIKTSSIHFKTTHSIINANYVVRTKWTLWRKHRRRVRSVSGNVCKAQMEDNKLSEVDMRNKKALQAALWTMEGVYICWLFLLPYAPGDPVWAIKPETIKTLLDLSLNFFFVDPLANLAGIHLLEAPVVHPTVEALFNFVIGWTLMFAPLLFTDRKRDRYGGSLEALWVVQMFLTNTLLLPYMAIRLSERSSNSLSNSEKTKSGFQSVMISGARIIGIVGGLVGVISILWALFGRANDGFGSLADRWDFFLNYLGTDRPGYAFIWDICLYSIFQPWLIGDNLENLDESKAETVRYLRFIPYLGLVAYLWALPKNEDQ
ncbi:uncharacterized protein LOC131065655 isoform X1 [Cryptomeria japonica]|uniref:uncharacterized protein LOC131065655 isoform X1 n=1 Tax=Cryptomeria japonica TaxID=3369 RepID=UPI0025AD160D|nr:uncharacterized protein LOC131065655 isoform X1 [Cryptomeria japonica]